MIVNLLNICLDVFLLCAGVSALQFAIAFYAKSKIETAVQIQCSSGDSEVMTFSYNFMKDEENPSKRSKVQEAFTMIEDRRAENHQKWLTLKAEAIKENEQKNPDELKLRSVTEGERAQLN